MIDPKLVESYITNKVAEGRTVEYKGKLPGGTDEDKKKFLATVSSFANASGGMALYGVEAEDGVPTGKIGLAAGTNLDQELLRLEDILRAGLDPRLPGLRVETVVGLGAGPIIAVVIPRSWVGPHMVTFKNSSRFFTRTSAGKHQMDVVEIRNAFLFSESIPERMRAFRDQRIKAILAGDTPVPFKHSGIFGLLMLPVTAFDGSQQFSLTVDQIDGANLLPMGERLGTFTHRINIDGAVFHRAGTELEQACDSFCQLHRSGVLEVVFGELIWLADGRKSIRGREIEFYAAEAVAEYVKTLERLGVPLPISVHSFALNAKGATMVGGEHRQFRVRSGGPIDRDRLLLPEILMENYGINAAEFLRPVFDGIWNATGYLRSIHYDRDGKWLLQGRK